MPTPFMHLQIVERLMGLNWPDGSAQRLIESNFPAFYLGNVAPDYQTICNIPRSKTHFYDLPPRPDRTGYPTMLAQYPELAKPESLPEDQAAFLVGYCAHLMLDLRWYYEVLLPYFVYAQDWGDHHYRFVVHNTLLTYLDKIAVDSLPETAAETLAQAQPDHWLPFANDADLIKWRDMLVPQLHPDGRLQTIEIYSRRLRMSPVEFEENLKTKKWMEEHLYSRVPIENVQSMLTSAVIESMLLIIDLLTRK
jgi:hypothetical protein